jgi:hypothetical protein
MPPRRPDEPVAKEVHKKWLTQLSHKFHNGIENLY